MGLDHFSVQANAILEIKHIINNSNLGKLRAKVRKITRSHNLDEIESLVDKLNS